MQKLGKNWADISQKHKTLLTSGKEKLQYGRAFRRVGDTTMILTSASATATIAMRQSASAMIVMMYQALPKEQLKQPVLSLISHLSVMWPESVRVISLPFLLAQLEWMIVWLLAGILLAVFGSPNMK